MFREMGEMWMKIGRKWAKKRKSSHRLGHWRSWQKTGIAMEFEDRI